MSRKAGSTGLMKKRLRTIIVVGITLALLALVLRRVGLADLLDTLRGADLRYLALSVLVTPLLAGVSVAKWQALLRAEGHDVAFFYLVKLYLAGYFFNYFLPSNVGGDVVRIVEVGSHIGDHARGAASVFMERFTGLLVLALLAVVSFLTNLTLFDDRALTLALALALAGVGGIVWLVLDPRLLSTVERVARFKLAQAALGKFRRFYDALHAYRGRRRALVTAFLLSLVFYVLAILNVWLCSLTFHQPVSLLDVAILVPIIMVVAMLPLTFNGYGLQEWAYVLLYPRIGLPATVGLSAIVLVRAKNLAAGLVGGLLYPGIRLANQRDDAPSEPPEPPVRPEAASVTDRA